MDANLHAPRPSAADRFARFAPHTVALAFLVMVVVSWRRWTSPLVDVGREMDLPRRLLEGELLYRDVHYIYAPLSPYINALLYRLFGLHHDVLIASSLIGAALVALLCYRIARRLLAPHLAAVAVLTILVWCIFRPNGNMIAPYSYGALHGALCALGSLLCTLRYAERRRWTDLLGAGALVGLAAITKLEFALPAATTIIAATTALHWGEWRTFVLRLGAAGSLGAIIGLPLYGWWFGKLGWRMLIVDCHILFTHLPPSLIYYNKWRAGTDHPWYSLAGVIGGAAVWLLVISLVLIFCLMRARRRRGIEPSVRLWRNAKLALVGSIAVILAVLPGGRGWDGSPMRAVPLLLAAVIVREGWRIRRGESADQRSIALLLIAVYSLVMLARVVLRVPSGGPYGGLMLPTSFIFIFYMLVEELPRWIARLTEDEQNAKPAQALGAGLILTLIVLTSVDSAIRYRTMYVEPAETHRGRFLVGRLLNPAYPEALDFLLRHSSPGDRIAVFPEGSDLAFLTDRRMPLRHQIFLPGLMSEPDERRAIEQLASEPIRYVFIANRPTGEFGAVVWGRDYYRALDAAIRRDYRVVKVCGRDRNPEIEIGNPEFFIKILERK